MSDYTILRTIAANAELEVIDGAGETSNWI